MKKRCAVAMWAPDACVLFSSNQIVLSWGGKIQRVTTSNNETLSVWILTHSKWLCDKVICKISAKDIFINLYAIVFLFYSLGGTFSLKWNHHTLVELGACPHAPGANEISFMVTFNWSQCQKSEKGRENRDKTNDISFKYYCTYTEHKENWSAL